VVEVVEVPAPPPVPPAIAGRVVGTVTGGSTVSGVVTRPSAGSVVGAVEATTVLGAWVDGGGTTTTCWLAGWRLRLVTTTMAAITSAAPPTTAAATHFGFDRSATASLYGGPGAVGQNPPVRAWVVAAGLIEGPGGFVLVQNRRRDGSLDWSPPGGVIEVAEGEDIADGLTREVREETGLTVDGWVGPLFDVEVVAEGLGWSLRAETYLATSFHGDLEVDDPDGIVVDARFVDPSAWLDHLEGTHPWVREPIEGWLAGPGMLLTSYRYRLDGPSGAVEVVRLHGMS
jgi:8-oxo-dGTP diphosphatase